MLILYVIMSNIIKSIEDKFKKPVIDVRPGDTVRVNQRIQEGTKTRVQMFEGLVIRVTRKNSLSVEFDKQAVNALPENDSEQPIQNDTEAKISQEA